MASPPDIALQLIDALDEPALLVEGGKTRTANKAARALLGQAIEGSDVRLALRHPDAVQLLQSETDGDIEIAGLGSPDQPWLLSVRSIGGGRLLVRLRTSAAN